MAKQIKVKLVKSSIGRPEKHKKVLDSLGLKKLNKVVTLYDTPQVMGAINKVSHLVQIIES